MLSIVKMEAMDMDPVDVTSHKRSNSEVNSLLMSGWKERWTPVQFGLRVKQNLPRGVSGDYYDLAECIIQQSLVGMSPNRLMLSYLTHCLQSGFVSYGSVISCIASFTDFQKTDSVLCLLDLIQWISVRISCRNHEDESVKLAISLVHLSAWLFACARHAVIKSDSTSMANKVMAIISSMAKSSFMVSLFNVGKREDDPAYQFFVKSFDDFLHVVEHEKPDRTSAVRAHESAAEVLNFRELVDWRKETPYVIVQNQLMVHNSNRSNTTSAFSSINAVIAFNAILDPVSDVTTVCEQLLMISKLHQMDVADLFLEIIRSCLIGLVDAGAEELKWGAFTFLKIPQVLAKLEDIAERSNEGVRSGRRRAVYMAMQKLIKLSPLLDQADHRSNCDCLSLLMKEFRKTNLMSEEERNEIEQKRTEDSKKSVLLGKKSDSSSNPSQPSLILKAEPTVTSILKTLDVDYTKNVDALLSVLVTMQGKSFVLIMVAAASTSKLKYFTMKLLMFNDNNKQTASETGKQSQTRSLIFDITFLMLCQICQNYGIKTITEISETKDTFFTKWCSQCMPATAGNFRNPDLILKQSDEEKVDVLLKQFMRPEFDVMKTDLPKWHEVCLNLPAAVREILLAWEYGSENISTEIVKQVLDNVKSRICCLPIVVSAWLCSYISTLHHDQRLKPMNMLQQFLIPTVAPASDSSDGSGDQLYYKERSALMTAIVRKMMHDLIPPQTTTKSQSHVNHRLTSRVPLSEVLENAFTSIHTKSWLETKVIHEIQVCYWTGGAEWFVESLVRQLMRKDQTSDLSRAVAVIFGLMHIDLQACVNSLVQKILPSFLMSSSKQDLFFEPRASALARLTVLAVHAAIDLKRVPCVMVDYELEQALQETSFMKKRMLQKDESSEFMQVDHSDPLTDPFVRSLAKLMVLFHGITSDPDISQRSIFPVLFLQQLILCAKQESEKITQFLPIEVSMNLLRVSGCDLSFEFLCAISDTETGASRRHLSRCLCQLNRLKMLNT